MVTPYAFFISKNIRRVNVRIIRMNPLYKRNLNRAKKVSSFHKGYIERGQKILDIGLGNGLNASQMRRDYGVDIVGIDVIDYNQSDIKLKIFDGESIPFKNGEFDVALITEALHHCHNAIRILEEAKRVAKRIIIFEDIYTSKLHLFISKAYDFLMNFRHGVNTPFNFRQHEDWLRTFKKMKLKIAATKEYRGNPWYSPMKTRFYVLDK